MEDALLTTTKQRNYQAKVVIKLKVLQSINLKITLGGFGEVKLCSHKITGEERAVKFMRKEQMTPKAKIWFENEINILKTLDHPNIVKLYEIYEDEFKYYLV